MALCQDNDSFVYCETEEHQSIQHQSLYEKPAPITNEKQTKLHVHVYCTSCIYMHKSIRIIRTWTWV